MTVGATPRQAGLLTGTAAVCDGRVSEGSIFSVLHRECHRLFPDDMFADLFADTGRRSVPPMIVAVVMVLQRLLGLSDREAVEAFYFDARWKYACGGLDFDYPGFAHTVLVDMRTRLAASERPRRIFEVTVDAAHSAGLVGAKRVLDSTPLYDAVATMDTVTLVRSAMRNLFKAADDKLEAGLRGVLTSGDDYASTAKPQVDWDDAAAREELIDSRAKDAFACLVYLDGRTISAEMADAARLLATVLGQDLEDSDDGRFRIARRVAKDRVISTVDPQARHGHKTSARGFDGYKGHAAVDPDSEIITDTVVTPGNAGDASVAEDLIDDLLTDPVDTEPVDTEPVDTEPVDTQPVDTRPVDTDHTDDDAEDEAAQPAVYGDAAYGTGKFLSRLHDAGIEAKCKTQPPVAAGGMFSKDHFYIELAEGIVTCPAGEVAEIRWGAHGGGTAYFALHCATCPLAPECTTSSGGRTITVNPYEQTLSEARQQQAAPEWLEDYRGTRPKVERKLGHLMRRKHGGRRARVRGTTKVDADFNLLAAAANMARLAVLGLRSTALGGWTAIT
jgi:IS5 family transposase